VYHWRCQVGILIASYSLSRLRLSPDKRREAFKAYIAEDCIYLDVFAKVLRLALGKSAGLPPNVSRLLNELHDGIAEELRLHKGYERETAKSMGLFPERPQAQCKATKVYTDFLLSTAETEVPPKSYSTLRFRKP